MIDALTNNTRKTEVVWYGDGPVTTGPSTLTWVSRGPEVRATKSGRDAAVWHVTQAGDNAFTAAAHEASATP